MVQLDPSETSAPASDHDSHHNLAVAEPVLTLATSDPLSPVSANVVARFEFETGKANDGTKVLLVEWDCDEDEPSADAVHVDWDGKTEVLPVIDRDCAGRRLVFWLPPTAVVPPTISIRRPGKPVLQAKPLPAIFAPGLGGQNPPSGRRGVLHTLWATLRLSALQDEVRKEMKENTESVGLDMALKEKEFILDHFGLSRDGAKETLPVLPPLTTALPVSRHSGAMSPLSTRMTEKLKGLRLATSPEGLAAAASGANSQARSAPQPSVPGFVPLSGTVPMGIMAKSGHPDGDHDDEEEDGELFALPMSPRSPEMKRSPFSLL